MTTTSNEFDPLLLFPMPRKILRRPETTRAPAPATVIDPSLKTQGYRLSITPEKIQIIASDPAGIFHAQQTLDQLHRQFPGALPCLEIEDWPDFPIRGVMLDISRDKVPTLPTRFEIIDMLSHWKINQLQLYMEQTFAYQGHQEVWQNSSPMTPDEIRALDDYCKAHFIDLVPNQNSLGHMERWLKHPRYLPLAEAPDGSQTPWGFRWNGPFSLCPTDPKSLDLLADLYTQLLPNFSSKLFNVGCDETFDIGQGRSRAQCEKIGVTQVYLQFLNKIQKLVSAHGRKMMFWADGILQQPKLIPDLPPGAIALNWGYEADHPFDTEAASLAESKIPFYVSPGTSSWCSIAGRTGNMLLNQRSAASAGLKHGAIGYLNTDWGDFGHLQYWPISFAGLAAGAGLSWCAESNNNLPLDKVLNAHAFLDESAVMGKLACDLGNIYRTVGKLHPNRSALFNILVPSAARKDPMDGITMEGIESAEAVIDAAIKPLETARMKRTDARLIQSEFKNAAAMLKHACQKGRQNLGHGPKSEQLADELRQITQLHRDCWLQRNRPGGLDDSVARLSPK